MANKIRLGFVGASPNSHWANASHLPALMASPDVELTAVCTTQPESAAEALKKYRATFAFHDYREMMASPQIDAVAVVIRVPRHYEVTKAAIDAGKHVYVEWPLGRTTAEAEELTAIATAKGLVTACGLQSRVSPALAYMKDLIATGYVGDVLSCHVSALRDGPIERPSRHTWQRDVRLGANPLTIHNGHVIDALRFVAGNFDQVACMATTQSRQWYETDTKKFVDVTAPDNVIVSGKLLNGAVASVHSGIVPWGGSGYRMEIYGNKGTLTATGNISSQRGKMLRVQGTQESHELQDLAIPDHYSYVPAEFPRGDPFNVGQMYALFAEAIRGGKSRMPTFDTAVDLHHFIDTLRRASEKGTLERVTR
jgi:predicted dehydrogenase